MKYLKITFVAFLIACLFAIINVTAYAGGYQSVVGVELPRFASTISPFTLKKEYDGYQYYSSSGTIDQMDGEYIKVYATLKHKSSNTKEIGWLALDKGKHEKWTEQITQFKGETYTLTLKRKWSGFTASHSGGWYLDDRFNQLH